MEKRPGLPEPQKVIDIATKATALIATLCFLLSIVYDWGYLHALGLDFSQVPTSLTDHVRSALVWIPETILILGAVTVLELFHWRVERGMPEEELIASSRRPEFTRRFRQLPSLLFIVIGILGGLLWVLLGDRFRGALPIAAMVIWVLFILWLLSHPRVAAALAPIVRRVLIWVPVGSIVVYSFGYTDGRYSLKVTREPARIFLKSASVLSPVKYHLLRQFEGFVLARDSSGGVVLVPAQEISRIEGFAKPSMFRFRGILCSQFGVACEKSRQELLSSVPKSSNSSVQPTPASGRG